MLEARDLSEAWYLVLKNLFKEGYETEISRGAYEGGQRRLQLQGLAGFIENPLPIIVPEVPQGIPSPTSLDYINTYFKEKIVGNVKEDNCEYTYGERILLQLQTIIEILMETPETNQAVIEVARPEDIFLKDPPCLRCITLKKVGPRLNMTTFWRSWDLFSGFPTNLGGLSLLLEYIAGFLEGIEPGRLYFYSDGAHIYDMEKELAARKLAL